MLELGVEIEDFVFERVPDYRRAVIAGVRTHAPDTAAIRDGLSAAARKWQSQATGEIVTVPSVQRWRKAYRRVGLNPTRTRPALEALARRARSGKMGSFGDACVDIGAIVSLLCLVPVGMHTVDGVSSTLALTRAIGHETFRTFSGDVEHPAPGELVWVSGEQVLTRHWVHQQGAVGSVNERSATFTVNLDLLAEDTLAATQRAMVDWLELAGISVTSVSVFDRGRPAGRVRLSSPPA
ncbi:MAG TPA: phenylalanine--tRNA ligase beta subunit-related protein [Solirubrobacteraceae bacterium]|nr:phenylalanine--tRNA ligase beta subunit-related protein [Solirubrobacteraceae bacterium]